MKLLFFIIPYLLTTTIQVNNPQTNKKQKPKVTQGEKKDVTPKQTPVANNISKIAPLSSNKSIMIIDVNKRTTDLINVFNSMKKEFSYSQVSINLTDGTSLNNITEIAASQDSTIILIKQATNQGVKQQAVFTEDIKGISTL